MCFHVKTGEEISFLFHQFVHAKKQSVYSDGYLMTEKGCRGTFPWEIFTSLKTTHRFSFHFSATMNVLYSTLL